MGSLFSGAVAATIIGGIVWFLRRPRFRLSAQPREPWCVQVHWDLPGNLGAVAQAFDGLKNYYRIRVVNTGRTIAKRCHLRLTDVWYVERGVWRNFDRWQADDLIWSGRPASQTVDLSPAEETFCDVGYVASDFIQNNVEPAVPIVRRDGPRPAPDAQGRFVLCVATPQLAQPNGLEQGHYVLKIAAYSDNASTKSLYCDLWYSGASALITDAHVDQPLARTVLQERASVPEVNTLDEEIAPF